MWGYKVAFVFYATIAVVCFGLTYWVVFGTQWAWYWKLIACWLLIPTGLEAVKLAYHAWELDKIFR